MKANLTTHAAIGELMLLALSQTGCVQTQATRLTAEARPPVPEEAVQVYRLVFILEAFLMTGLFAWVIATLGWKKPG